MIIFQMFLIPLVVFFLLGAVFIIVILSKDLADTSDHQNWIGTEGEQLDPAHPASASTPTSVLSIK